MADLPDTPHAPAPGSENESVAAPAPAAVPVSAPVPAPVPAPAPVPTPSRVLTAKNPWFWGTGRRKTAVARVRMRPGTGKFLVQVKRISKRNADTAFKDINVYFTEDRDRNDAVAPLKATNTLGRVDVYVRLTGGGYMGQAGALLLGVSRALKEFDPNLEPTLREHGFLTRDSREVERKKYGQAGARKKFQFSKR